MYANMLFALPIGILAAFSPQAAEKIGNDITAYPSALPEELYALHSIGYLGQTAAPLWGKVKKVD